MGTIEEAKSRAVRPTSIFSKQIPNKIAVPILVAVLVVGFVVVDYSAFYLLGYSLLFDPAKQVPSGYYRGVDYWVPHWTQLDDLLESMPIPNYYEVNVFDCSERSAYVEWYLENCGVHARIVVGYAQLSLKRAGIMLGLKPIPLRVGL